MTPHRIHAAACLLIAATALPGCERAKPKPPKETIGHVVTQLSVKVGSIWGGGYRVDVVPGEYALVQHANCAEAKDQSKYDPKGFCVVRITKEQSDRFEAAMERFKENAIPLQDYSFDDRWVRPDGKPCRSEATDSTLMTLFWNGTEGVKMAGYYDGCDEDEFKDFYSSVLAVTDPLPIQKIIKER